MSAKVQLVREKLSRGLFSEWLEQKRFAADISWQARERGEITEKQAARLEIQAWIFRRQIPKELLPDNAPEGYLTPKQRAQLTRQ